MNEKKQVDRIPDWCQFYISLGCAIARCQSGKERLFIGLSLPTRSFAAAFIAFGIVKHKAHQSDEKSIEEHFERLSIIKKGTPLVFRVNNKLKYGYFIGITTYHGERAISVADQNKPSMRHIFLKRKALDIAVTNDKNASITETDRKKHIEPMSEYTKLILGDVSPVEYSANSRIECLLIGRASWLRFEIERTEFAVVKDKAGMARGNLQDILKVRRFLGNITGYKTELLPSSRQNAKGIDQAADTDIVIFDGCDSFLKWKNRFPNSLHVVLLDRTQRGYENARWEFNYKSRENHRSTVNNFVEKVAVVPSGIEMAVFKECLK